MHLTRPALAIALLVSTGVPLLIPSVARADAACTYYKVDDNGNLKQPPEYIGPDGPGSWEESHPWPVYWRCKVCLPFAASPAVPDDLEQAVFKPVGEATEPMREALPYLGSVQYQLCEP